MRRTPDAARRRGFTLLEVLVVMALLSLVALAMGSALRTTAQTEARVDERLARADEMRVASDFLRSVLGRISAQRQAGALAAGASPYLFSGAAQEMRWLGIMPARYGAGGRHYFSLAVDERGLVLRYLPWRGEKVPDWSAADSLVLVPQATELALRYEDAGVEPSRWLPQWTATDGLPQRVALSVQTAQGGWPELVVTLRALALSDPRLGGQAVFGGTQ